MMVLDYSGGKTGRVIIHAFFCDTEHFKFLGDTPLFRYLGRLFGADDNPDPSKYMEETLGNS